MRRLILFRHGKSDWHAPYGSDHERPLSERGVRAAATMGRLLAQSGLTPDHAITSSAVRAEATLEMARTAGNWTCSFEVSDRLYGATAEGALEVASNAPIEAATVMLVGHEPTWSDLVHRLTGGYVTVKTATLVGMDLPIDSWSDVDTRGSAVFLFQPRDFTSWMNGRTHA